MSAKRKEKPTDPEVNPLYFALAEDMRAKISQGEWKEGQQIPTEEQLSLLFNVSRTTVRRALEILVQERMLQKIRPKGTFVRPASERDYTLRTFNRGFTEEMVERGGNPKTLLAKVTISHANLELAQKLHLEPGDEVLYLERLRGDGIKAFVYFETWLSSTHHFSLRANDYYGSLYQLLREKGYAMRKQYEEFEAILPSERIAAILDVKPETAILKRTIGAVSHDKNLYEYTTCYYIGNEYLYRFDYQ